MGTSGSAASRSFEIMPIPPRSSTFRHLFEPFEPPQGQRGRADQVALTQERQHCAAERTMAWLGYFRHVTVRSERCEIP